jgi:hypothetical protein
MFEAGQWIVYERAGDYWGGDLNVKIGHSNFDSQIMPASSQ